MVSPRCEYMAGTAWIKTGYPAIVKQAGQHPWYRLPCSNAPLPEQCASALTSKVDSCISRHNTAPPLLRLLSVATKEHTQVEPHVRPRWASATAPLRPGADMSTVPNQQATLAEGVPALKHALGGLQITRALLLTYSGSIPRAAPGFQTQLHMITSLSPDVGPVSCLRHVEGNLQAVDPLGLWSRLSGAVKVPFG